MTISVDEYLKKVAPTPVMGPGASAAAAANAYATPKTSVPQGSGASAAAAAKSYADANPQPAEYKTPTSVSGTNLQSYNEDLSKNLGKDPGYTTTAGAEYAKRVETGLKGPDASSVNVQNTADTNASRRQYMANLQAGEAIGQSGFGTGTAQADRIRMNAQSGVNSANQAGQNSANDYLRQRTEQNMQAANNLEGQQYNKAQTNIAQVQGQDVIQYGRSENATDRGLQAAATAYGKTRDSVGDAQWNKTNEQNQAQIGIQNSQWNTTNQQNQTQQGVQNAQWSTLNGQQQQQLAFENAQVLKGNDQTAQRNLINSLPDGPAKNQAIQALGSGTPIAEVLKNLFNPDGSLVNQGKTPAALALEGEKESAGQQAELEGQTKGSDAYLKRVNEIILAGRNAKNQPITDATTATATKDALTVMSKDPSKLDPTQKDLLVASGDIKSYPETASVPVGNAAKGLIGEELKIGQDFYTVVNTGSVIKDWEGIGSNNKKTDYTELKGPNGPMYVVNGQLTANKPKDVPRPSSTDNLFNAFGIGG